MNNTKQSMAKKGSLNPMSGKKHSQQTRKKISDAQKMRYQAIRKALEEHKDLLHYAKTDSKTRRELLRNLLDNNSLSFKSIQQAINFIGIMLSESKFQSIIKEEIDRFLSDCDTYGNV